MNELQKCAEILVEQGYAESLTDMEGVIIVRYGKLQLYPETANPFYSGDTHRECLARRQADAIEDWLLSKQKFALACYEPTLKTAHLKRLDRIKYCIQELIK